MENMKLPLALVLAMAAQLAGGVWWVSQQAATIESLQETVSVLTAENRASDKVNMQRDIEENAEDIQELWDDTELLWEEANTQAKHMLSIMELQQRVSVLENTIRFMDRDHKDLLDPRH